MAFNLIRPMVARTGINAQVSSIRAISTSRAAAIQATRQRKSAVVSADETAGYKVVPGGPILPGTVNDATPTPPAERAHGSYHWVAERSLSAALIPIMGAAAVTSAGGSIYPVVDAVLATSLIVHSHIGFQQVLIDYASPHKFKVVGNVMAWALRILTGLSVWGVYEFNTGDIGLTELVRKVWRA